VTDLARLSPPERFNCLIEGLFNDVRVKIAWGWALLPMMTLIWRRLHRMRRRFNAIVAQLRAGTLPAPGSAPRRPATARRDGPRPKQPYRCLGWVVYEVSYFVWGRHFELDEMLEEPETETLLTTAPQLGRVLRPLCRMLKVKPPPYLRLPRRPRPVVEKFPPAPDFIVNAPGAICRPDGTVWMRLGASTLWREGCGETLEEAQKFDYPHKIWPRED
jgi:hypothetical protein